MIEPIELPIWFPLKKIKSLNQTPLDEKTWKNYIVDRINLLSPNGKKNFTKDSLETYDEFEKRGIAEIQSHIVLRLGVCMDARLSAWFIESEGDLFNYRFLKSKWKEKRHILNYLFPQDNLEPTWLELHEAIELLGDDLPNILNISEEKSITYRPRKGLFPSYPLSDSSGMNKIIALDFRFASFLVKTRKAILYKGWVFGSVEKLTGTIKIRFELLLNEHLTEYAERLETATGGATKKLAKEISELLYKLIKPRREYSIENINLKGKFDDHIKYYPPCIQDLITTINQVGYIAHWERLQLGLFLKHTGMNIDDQMHYWYEKAVDNVGLSYKEFSKKAGYMIRHIYGLEGGKIDYDMPSCSTIQNKMYCTFRHRDYTRIIERIDTYIETIEDKEKEKKTWIVKDIKDLTIKGIPKGACAKHHQLVFATRIEKIFHPLQYLKIAAKSSDILIEDVKVKKEPIKESSDEK